MFARSNGGVSLVEPSPVANGMGETCSICGRVSDPDADGDPPITWSADIVETSTGNATRWVCSSCTRRYVRAIEAKLDQQWW